MYYTYMLRCEDDTIYTGITTNLERRMEEHFTKNKKCAKYTLRHTAKRLEGAWCSQNRKLAAKLEYAIKQLTKPEKEILLCKQDVSLVKAIEAEDYTIWKKIKCVR